MPEGLTAAALAEAVEHLVRQRDGILMIKLGGSALDDPAAAEQCLRGVAVLHQLRFPLLLLHGGGKAIDRAMQQAGLTPRKIAGRRYTDTETLAIVVRVLQQINRDLTRQLQQLGVAALSALDFQPFPLEGELLSWKSEDGSAVDLGWVGTVARVNQAAIRVCIEQGQVPIFPSLAAYAASPLGWLNVNADTVAASLAGALAVTRAVFLTDTPGVLRHPTDAASVIPELTAAEAQALMDQGVIHGGMIPKVEACLQALEAGAATAVILDGRRPFALLELFLHKSAGTRLRR
ncbi:MAG: acetylglutamate kinase [Thermogemmata sp.]|jgi:acetylglutamate kinase